MAATRDITLPDKTMMMPSRPCKYMNKNFQTTFSNILNYAQIANLAFILNNLILLSNAGNQSLLATNKKSKDDKPG